MQVLENLTGLLQAGLDALAGLLGGLPGLGEAYTTGVRCVLPVLALLILLTAIRSKIGRIWIDAKTEAASERISSKSAALRRKSRRSARRR